MRLWHAAAVLAILAGVADCQSNLAVEFEAASVKLEPPGARGQPGSIGSMPVMRGGPGTSEPGRIHYSHATLMALLTRAYGVYADQVVGPGWLTSEKYTVEAVVPAGAGKEQFDQMLRNLLVQRFDLVIQREDRNFSVYDLVVAKSGSKLGPPPLGSKGDVVDLEAPPAFPTQPVLDSEGCPVIRPGTRAAFGSVGANNCKAFRRYSISEFVKVLEMMVALESGSYFGPQASQAHVVDRTGLSGEFDFNLTYNLPVKYGVVPGGPAASGAGDPPDGGGLSAALEKQLGLKLQKRKSKLSVLLIQRARKVPAEN